MKADTFKQKLKHILGFIPRFIKNQSMSTQLIVTLILIFASFFLLQTILNNQFFGNFYADQEFDRIHSDLINYIDEMNEPDNDYYDIMDHFTSENNAYSVIVNGQYRILGSGITNYTITVESNLDQTQYTFLVPNNDYNYQLGETLSTSLYEYNTELYSPQSIEVLDSTIFTSDVSCTEETCLSVEGNIVEINKPNNINYLYNDNIQVELELSKLASGTLNLDDYEYQYGDETTGYWYRSSDGPVDTLVFVHNLKTWNWIVTIVPIADTNDIISIISSYNYYVYLTAIAIIFIWSFRLSNIISKPIKNIELVAREIAQLNFNVSAKEFNNRENKSLSNSINLISRNLKETLETVNKKNQELTNLYEEQSNQVTLKKQLVSSISHELKTPLMIMQVTIQGILDGIIDEKDIDEELDNVIEEINKSSIMIQDMLQIYRLDDANSELDISEFNLSNMIHFFIKDFENAIKNYQFDVDLNVIDDIFIEADKKLIQRVISNFITNAIKYTPEGEKMYIELSEKDDCVYFELTNYGANIDKNEIEKIWIPFYRIEQKNQNTLNTKGSGIGLYLVSEILKAHDAEFNIINVKNGVKAWFKIKKIRN
jgi:signal transduction histidine kinase